MLCRPRHWQLEPVGYIHNIYTHTILNHNIYDTIAEHRDAKELSVRLWEKLKALANSLVWDQGLRTWELRLRIFRGSSDVFARTESPTLSGRGAIKSILARCKSQRCIKSAMMRSEDVGPEEEAIGFDGRTLKLNQVIKCSCTTATTPISGLRVGLGRIWLGPDGGRVFRSSDLQWWWKLLECFRAQPHLSALLEHECTWHKLLILKDFWPEASKSRRKRWWKKQHAQLKVTVGRACSESRIAQTFCANQGRSSLNAAFEGPGRVWNWLGLDLLPVPWILEARQTWWVFFLPSTLDTKNCLPRKLWSQRRIRIVRGCSKHYYCNCFLPKSQDIELAT